MEPKKIYLATPYTAPSEEVRIDRFYRVSLLANQLMQAGVLVYSPVTHGHVLSMLGDLPHDFTYWREHCLSFLHGWASELWVLPLPGWEQSRGVQAEIAEAKALGIPVRMCTREVDVHE